MSDDGRYGLTLILMIGSVFSPHYRRAFLAGRGDPARHSAVNLALYDLRSPGGSWLGPLVGRRTGDRWALTEGGLLTRDRSTLSIGRSRAAWDGGALRVEVCEVTSPFASPLEGELTVVPGGVADEVHALDGAGRHVWSPIAPVGRIEARFHAPDLRFSGHAYLDHNAGEEPLSSGFRSWTWSRFTSERKTTVVYDVLRADGSDHRIARSFHADGARETCRGEGTTVKLAKTSWQVERSIRAMEGSSVSLGRTLEDTPFYARSELTGSIDGRPATGVHEVVDLRRFQSPVVQAMLPYRMRRLSA